MSPYKHLTLKERETILLGINNGWTQELIAKEIGRSKSTISREVSRNGGWNNYSVADAHARYQDVRQGCRRHRILDRPEVRERVITYITQYHWSPEQIAGRLRYENSTIQISYPTIYRGIYRDNLGVPRKNHGARGIPRQLRHRGKTRKVKGTINERRGRFNDVPSIHERPVSAKNRSWFGHWEGDTVRGKTGRSALVTLVDRKSRFLLSMRVSRVNADNVKDAMVALLSAQPNNRVRTVTPDRGTEFARYRELAQELNTLVFFPDPHAPQQRGTNENTNGLIREYFPKNTDLDLRSDEAIEAFVEQLNNRPRKVLGWKTPSEVYLGKKLHLS
ncbi:IS30 family transposase [Lacticaseibacillus baoqingensis]|uniref:IS30 family transposase n=1 Tax=Lacticaseibacillus baoqingensis TaxID=2486013 RepID=UPI000F7ACB99|nr:IS30 family transposase [Lacticaseibacillus baoqingensis]